MPGGIYIYMRSCVCVWRGGGRERPACPEEPGYGAGMTARPAFPAAGIPAVMPLAPARRPEEPGYAAAPRPTRCPIGRALPGYSGYRQRLGRRSVARCPLLSVLPPGPGPAGAGPGRALRAHGGVGRRGGPGAGAGALNGGSGAAALSPGNDDACGGRAGKELCIQIFTAACEVLCPPLSGSPVWRAAGWHCVRARARQRRYRRRPSGFSARLWGRRADCPGRRRRAGDARRLRCCRPRPHDPSQRRAGAAGAATPAAATRRSRSAARGRRVGGAAAGGYWGPPLGQLGPGQWCGRGDGARLPSAFAASRAYERMYPGAAARPRGRQGRAAP